MWSSVALSLGGAAVGGVVTYAYGMYKGDSRPACSQPSKRLWPAQHVSCTREVIIPFGLDLRSRAGPKVDGLKKKGRYARD